MRLSAFKFKFSDKPWRDDNKCGHYEYPLPDGSEAECNPDGESPCCNFETQYRQCGNTTRHCQCQHCVDYRTVRHIRESEDSCIVTPLQGFMKRVCFNEDEKRYFYQCAHSDTLYEAEAGLEDVKTGEYYLTRVSWVCPNDPHVYQACGFNTKISYTDTDILCNGYFCYDEGADEPGVQLPSDCDCPEAANAPKRQFRYISCGEDCVRTNVCRSSIWVLKEDDVKCDDKCDEYVGRCRDESFCNGHMYGLRCEIDSVPEYIPLSSICGVRGILSDDCFAMAQEDCDPFNSTGQTCFHYQIHQETGQLKTVPIFDYARCGVFNVPGPIGSQPYCVNFLDQTNCSDAERVGGQCLVQGYRSNVSKFVVCDFKYKTTSDDTELCHDNLENQCFSPIMSKSNCKVHKHKMCNGIDDCVDRSDEQDPLCVHMTEHFMCERWFDPTGNRTTIPYAWVKDGVGDCTNGEDENNLEKNWLICNLEDSREVTMKEKLGNETCKNVLKCPKGGYVEFGQLCDGLDSCTDDTENSVCTIARDFPDIPAKAEQIGNVREVCNVNESICEMTVFKRPQGEVFGESSILLNVPSSRIDCSDKFGEHYVFLSCLDLCQGVSCPIEGQTLRFDSCPGQYEDRVYTLANKSSLTFVTKLEQGQYHQDIFQCENSKCVGYDKVCNLVDDCGDMSDELHCQNHMICKDTLNNHTKSHLISFDQRCDGIYDCFDLSDECNNFCGKEILEHMMIKCTCWFMGILAFFFNTFTVTGGLLTIRNCQTASMLMTKALVLVVGIGDLLIGIYLIVLSVYDSIVFREKFCGKQDKWLTGTPCTILGVISTLGSQLSVFAMTLLSVIRAHGIMGKELQLPPPADRKAVISTIIAVSAVVLSSLTVAVTPLLPALEDYFVQGMHYDSTYKVFIGFPNKAKHISVLREYFDRAEPQKKVAEDLSWQEIGLKVDEMFTQNKSYGSLSRTPVHFYGNDGVCLFKYFVRTDDARRSRQTAGSDITDYKGDAIVWAMLGINLTCYIFVTVSYILINLATKKSTETSGSGQNESVKEKNKQLQRKVTFIIATDFICWVPFIIISGLHNLKVIDASSWYLPFSMMVLPLNSVINPVIYDKGLETFLLGKFRWFKRTASQLRRRAESEATSDVANQ